MRDTSANRSAVPVTARELTKSLHCPCAIRAARAVLNEATSLLLCISLLMNMVSFPSWSQNVTTSGKAGPSKLQPRGPECGARYQPGYGPKQMEETCKTFVSMLEKQRADWLRDTKSHKTEVANLDELLQYYKWALHDERIKLGEDPGPDPGPGRPIFHEQRSGSMRLPDHQQE